MCVCVCFVFALSSLIGWSNEDIPSSQLVRKYYKTQISRGQEGGERMCPASWFHELLKFELQTPRHCVFHVQRDLVIILGSVCLCCEPQNILFVGISGGGKAGNAS